VTPAKVETTKQSTRKLGAPPGTKLQAPTSNIQTPKVE
jgi:hypothetical protein